MKPLIVIPPGLLLLFFYSISIAQNLDNSLLIKGEEAPDLEFPKIINYSSNSASLSDFKGKLIILYSWTTYCAPCIEAFPKLDSIQRKFSDQLQIILVGYEPEEKIYRLFDRMAKLNKNYILPNAIVDDRLFQRLLNEDGTLGGSIWIDGDGFVLGRARGSKFINEDNIFRVINGKEPLLGTKPKPTHDTVQFDSDYPLLIGGNGGSKDSFVAHSIITHYIPGLSDGGNRFDFPDTSGSVGRIMLLNTTIAGLYRIAYGRLITDTAGNNKIRPRSLSSAEIAFEFEHQNPYNPPHDSWDSLKYKYGYCYELIVPVNNSDALLQAMRSDLDRFFNLTASFEKREVDCFVLIKTGHKDISSDGGIPRAQKDNFGIIIKNRPITTLVEILRYYLAELDGIMLMLDETGIDRNIDVEFIAEMNDLEKVNRALEKFGMKILRTKRTIDKLIVREKSTHI